MQMWRILAAACALALIVLLGSLGDVNELVRASHSAPYPYLKGAVCPGGFDNNRVDIKAHVGVGGDFPAQSGWTDDHVDLATFVTLNVGDVLDSAPATLPYGNTKVRGVGGFDGTRGTCSNTGTEPGFGQLREAVAKYVSGETETRDGPRLSRSDDIHLLVYEDGLGGISFIWLECGNYSEPQPTDLGSISGVKFEDVEADGVKDGSDPLLGNWTVNLSGPVNGSDVTGAGGDYLFDKLPAGRYTVTEVLKAGWEQSFPLSGSHQVNVPSTGGSFPNRNFGNFRPAEKHGEKFFDLSRNGERDAGEVAVTGWKVVLTGTDGMGTAVNRQTFTDTNGEYWFTDIKPGSYTVTEVSPNASWKPTTPTSIDFNLKSGEIETGNDFGNVCLNGGGGHTLGFWSNKNGRAVMNDDGSLEPELALLRSLNLRSRDGSDFDPTTYPKFRKWLLRANGANMAYMLSAQLAAMALNVEADFVDPSALVHAPDLLPFAPIPGLDELGFISVANLTTASNIELGLHGFTPEGTPFEPYQRALKSSLNSANKDESFLQPRPCPFDSPY